MKKIYERINIHKNRNSNFELLRIFSMLMIIGHHLACHGVQHCLDSDSYILYNQGSSFHQLFVNFLLPGGNVGVGLFFMLTGFFQVDKKKFSLLKLLIESFFYGILLYIVFGATELIGIEHFSLSIKESFSFLAKSLLTPLSGGAWWFVSSYAMLLLLSPTINSFLEKLNKTGWIVTLIVAWLLWYSFGSISGTDYYNVARGVLFYFFGACIKKYGNANKKQHTRRYLWGGILCWLLSSITTYYMTALMTLDNYTIKYKMIRTLLSLLNSSVLIPLCVICFFCFFYSLKTKNSALINLIASTTFGIYLLHDSLIGRKLIWYDWLKVDALYITSDFFPLYCLLFIAIIFILCGLIDLFRQCYVEDKMKLYFLKLWNKIQKNNTV